MTSALPSLSGAGLSLLAALQVQIPAPTGMVNDFAGMLPAATAARLERLVTAVRAKSGGEIAVVTMRDLGGRDVADVALEIGRTWKIGLNAAIGNRARNAGVVLLVVPKETSADGRGHIFIATGQGAEGFLTDAITGDIRREALPFLRSADYASAITLMTQRIAERYAGEFAFTLDSADLQPLARPRPPPRRSTGGVSPVVFIIGFVVLFMILSSIGRRGGRGGRGGGGGIFFIPGGGGGGWSSGGGGGGGGGGGFSGFGGGGGFSGGGSGGDW